MLENLVRQQPTTVEVEYKNGSGFFVTFRYVGNAEIEQAAAQHRGEIRDGKMTVNPITESMRLAVAQGIVSWRGLTAAVLLSYLELDFDLEALAEVKGEIPCTMDDKLFLLRNDVDFNNWCQGIAYDISAMRELAARQAEKNLPAS